MLHEFNVLLIFLSHFWVKRAIALTDRSSCCSGREILVESMVVGDAEEKGIKLINCQ